MDHTKRILFLFLDGVGIGKINQHDNPFLTGNMPVYQSLLGGEMPTLHDAYRNRAGMTYKPINATLGVPGLPQSGTGQAALLTGVNAAKVIGRHFGPHLYSTLKTIVSEQNIFSVLQTNNKKALYANAFPRQFFDYLQSPRYRTTAIVHAWLSTGNKLNDHNSLRASRSLSADITNERWHKLGYPDISTITPQEAGMRLVDLTGNYDFVFFEYYLTDHAGHSRSIDEAIETLRKLDGLIEGILNKIDSESVLFLMTSDHGNIEDLSTKSHTRNPVPVLAVGKHHERFAKNITKITDVAPAIINMLI
jgi:hypothetical protein